MKRERLTVSQREAIRGIHDGRGYDNKRTLESLRKRGYLDMSWSLTPMGERAYEQIMQSGDGPERLKEMFRW